MRILICNWKDRRHPAAGGAEVYTHECAKRWAEAGHEVTLFCAAVEGEPEVDLRPGYRIVRRGIPFERTNVRKIRSPFAIFSILWKMAVLPSPIST